MYNILTIVNLEIIRMDKVMDMVWVEKYRPQTIEECILPKEIKATLQGFVDNNDMPNLILAGKAGISKTTISLALARQLGFEMLFINASLETGIDTVRNKIQDFCSSISLTGATKCVILDESDGLAITAQTALRAFIEKFSSTTRFIFTCNYVSKLIPAIHSRCTVINYEIPADEKNELMKAACKRLFFILKNENIEFDPKTVAHILSRFYPDMRRCINELQRYSTTGKIDNQALVSIGHDNFTPLIQALKTKNFKDMRQWVGTNSDLGSEKIFGYFYQNAQNFMSPNSIPQLVLTSAEYQYKAAFVADQEINLAAYFTELMSQCEFL